LVPLSELQVETICQRIADGGVTDAGLQQDLLDHYCCHIEEHMAAGISFEQAYARAFDEITPNGMSEIQEELFFLLTFKKQTNMKRTILITGALITLLFIAGIIFKYLAMPGASALIVLGIGITSLVFMPLVFVVKAREKQAVSERVLWGFGSLFAMALAFSVLFKVQHWPGANVLGVSSVIIILLGFLPLYFVTGYRNPLTRVNTVLSSVFIIIGCGLFFTLTMTPKSAHLVDVRTTHNFLRNEQILMHDKAMIEKSVSSKQTDEAEVALNKKIYSLCEDIKSMILRWDAGTDQLHDFEDNHSLIGHHAVPDYLRNNQEAASKLSELGGAVAQYNSTCAPNSSLLAIPQTSNLLDIRNGAPQYTTANALNDLFQIRLILLQNRRAMTASLVMK